MGSSSFNDIIKFAIERELEAAEFYGSMAKQAKRDASVAMFRDLEQMELGHARILENYSKETIKGFKMPEIPNLKLSDFMEAPAANEDMTYQEAFIIAMKREEAARLLYTRMADSVNDSESKNIFLRLASEESKHKLQLETMYDEEILKEN
jgi:rubrerythrin